MVESWSSANIEDGIGGGQETMIKRRMKGLVNDGCKKTIIENCPGAISKNIDQN